MAMNHAPLILSLLSLTLAAACSTTRGGLNLDLGPEITPSDEQAEELRAYIEKRKEKLRQIDESILFVGTLKENDSIVPWVETTSSEFRNRSAHCNFLKRVREQQITRRDLDDLRRLTKDFSICIAADVPKEDRSTWAFEMLRFFYERKWIVLNGKRYTPIELADQTLSLPDRGAPRLLPWSEGQMDATYSTRSAADEAALKAFPQAAEWFALPAPSDLSHLQNPTRLPTSAKELHSAHVGRFASVFVNERAMYFTASFGPADVPGIILHEYGHIVANEKHAHIEIHEASESATFVRDLNYDEACAETFDRVVTGQLYGLYPQLGLQWITKMELLSQLRPQDPHVVGNSIVLTQWDWNRDPIPQLQKLLEAGKLAK